MLSGYVGCLLGVKLVLAGLEMSDEMMCADEPFRSDSAWALVKGAQKFGRTMNFSLVTNKSADEAEGDIAVVATVTVGGRLLGSSDKLWAPLTGLAALGSVQRCVLLRNEARYIQGQFFLDQPT